MMKYKIMHDMVGHQFKYNTPFFQHKGTLVIIWEGDMRFYGISLCTAADQFSRKLGRTIALNRALYIKDKYSDSMKVPIRVRKNEKNLYGVFNKNSPIFEMPRHMYLEKEQLGAV